MNKFEEFMAFMANNRAEESAKEKSDLWGVTTSDNKEVNDNCFNNVKMILAGCSKTRITKLGMDELFDRLTKNFIKSNTEDDIRHFVSHNVVLKLVDILARK